MTAKIISGKELSIKIRKDIKKEVEELKKEGITPGLAVILVGDNSASQIYVKWKKRACEEVGINSYEYLLPKHTTQKELLELVEKLNNDNDVNGILVQLPIPKHLNEDEVLMAINPEKDVDGFHPINVGKLLIGNAKLFPCTPAGVMEMIKESGIEISGKDCVVVGRSNIVGKPQALMLLAENGTVTICHSKTKNLKEVTKRADILVVAIGRANFITGDMIKPGAVVIDVGMNRLETGKLAGDVNFNEAIEIAGAITPVPGGVGPMTITMLIKNTLTATKIKNLRGNLNE